MRKTRNPTITLSVIFKRVCNVSPSLIKLDVSRIKVEKVVKAPQKPTIRSNLPSGPIKNFSSASTEKSPIRKQPVKLTAKVP